MSESRDGALLKFADALAESLEIGTCTTENDVRNAFVGALIGSGITQSHIQREVPHPSLPQSYGWIDLLIDDYPAGSRSAIEFKYDRGIPSGYNQPRTQKAGALFADVVRLLHWPKEDARLIVYVADVEMRDYLTNSPSILARVFQEATGRSVHLDGTSFKGLPATFTRRVTPWPRATRLTTLLHRKIRGDFDTHFVWVFGVS